MEKVIRYAESLKDAKNNAIDEFKVNYGEFHRLKIKCLAKPSKNYSGVYEIEVK